MAFKHFVFGSNHSILPTQALAVWHQESNELGKLAEDPRHALSEVLGPAHSLSSIETKRIAPTARIDRSEGDVLEQRDAPRRASHVPR